MHGAYVDKGSVHAATRPAVGTDRVLESSDLEMAVGAESRGRNALPAAYRLRPHVSRAPIPSLASRRASAGQPRRARRPSVASCAPHACSPSHLIFHPRGPRLIAPNTGRCAAAHPPLSAPRSLSGSTSPWRPSPCRHVHPAPSQANLYSHLRSPSFVADWHVHWPPPARLNQSLNVRLKGTLDGYTNVDCPLQTDAT